jgi:hypothetical protein
VFVKGVTSALSQETTDQLWIAFLRFMRTHSADGEQKENRDLTLEALVSEVSKFTDASALVLPSAACYTQQTDVVQIAESKPIHTESKPIHTESIEVANVEEPISLSKIALVDLEDCQGITPEVLFRRHFKRFPTLFVAPGQPPMAMGLRCLDNEERMALEKWLNNFESDGLSLFDESILISLIRAPPRDGSIKVQAALRKLEKVLDVLEALWLIQALQERHFDAWFADIFRLHLNEVSYILFFFIFIVLLRYCFSFSL